MNRMNSTSRLLSRAVAGVFAFAVTAFGILSPAVRAQDTSTTTVRHGESSFDTEVRNAQVVYVEGNDLVLKMEDGKIEHLVVPDSDRFTISGNEVSVHELTPGTKLTQTITTTTTPRYVTSVRTLKGKVWHVSPHRSTVILTLPDGTNQSYTIPAHAKLTIGGTTKTAYDLRKGMNLEATVITDDTHTVVERNKSVVAELPAPPPTPREVGVLLFFQPAAAPEIAVPSAMVASNEVSASTLPRTGSSLPLVGLLGGLALATSLGMGAVRKAVRA
jgi:hypothetical protein